MRRRSRNACVGNGVSRDRRAGASTRPTSIDFYLSPTQHTAAAEQFLGKALKGLKHWELPDVINTDKAPTYAAVLAELKKGGCMP
jgi:transposase-like protein